jgi:hypothetical protein
MGFDLAGNHGSLASSQWFRVRHRDVRRSLAWRTDLSAAETVMMLITGPCQ